MGCDTEVIIVGGGLAGLALADHLQSAGIDYRLLEARKRLGGRILTGQVGAAAFDLGPSWFWPQQPRMNDLVKRFGLKVFDQYSKGTHCFEDENAQVHRGQGYASMEGSYRIEGGIASLTSALVGALDTHKIVVDATVRKIRKNSCIEVECTDGKAVTGKHVVLALPPRVASNFVYEPVFSDDVISAMQSIPTWMGGQAKFLAVYDHPFWREEGLSGDAMSRHGPLAEIHDTSDADAERGALFGFVGVPAMAREGQEQAIKPAALQQLGRLFGEKALSPKKVFYQDWAREIETSSELDQAPIGGHPAYGLSPALEALWGGRLWMGSTEVAPQFGGFLEGALEVAAHIANSIDASDGLEVETVRFDPVN